MEELNMIPGSERVVLIMAGGAGTRFWPASREQKPKQFLDILGTGRSLLQQTFDRSKRLVGADRIFIVTNVAYADKVLEELPGLSPEQIFLEPTRNNTAPCIAYASLKLRTRFPGAVCFVAPSDHIILQEDAFIRVAEQAFGIASQYNVLVTLGMSPTRPDTGYGYVQYDKAKTQGGAHPVKRFTEKPNLENAQAFLSSGDYLWNSGMFFWSLESILLAFDQHASNITGLLKGDQYFTAGEKDFLDRVYPQTENISIDYAILERARNVCVIPASFGWSDLGTWLALSDHLKPDTDGNIAVHKPVMLDNCKGTIVHTTPGKLVVASGLEEMVVICEDDVVLIFPKEKEQEVKALRERLKTKGLTQYL